MANSSPPTLATVSCRRTVSTRRWLTCWIRSSPAACPFVSLTDLKWSRSTKNMHTGSPTRRDLTSSCSTRSSKRRRFGNPVRASCQAMCETFSRSSRFCSVVAAWSARPDSRSWRSGSRMVSVEPSAPKFAAITPRNSPPAKSGATTEAAMRDRSSMARSTGSSVVSSRTITSRELSIRSMTGVSDRMTVGPPPPAPAQLPGVASGRIGDGAVRSGGGGRPVAGWIGPRAASGDSTPFVQARGTSWPRSRSQRYTVDWSQSVTAGVVSANNWASSANVVTRERVSENERRVRAVASLRLASVRTLKMSRAAAAYSANRLST